ncbi:permease domain-containing protein [Clostridium putrefaciens]|uniref:Permease domain-containing protein n=1 Tax=Clostridium putrefaciens TaxID=99675 RepID=A0A381J3Y5_9CLOT|nr:ABC transporter permease [Clostridium putrefaciens]SUY45280.1 permease domain-containing protein [Clostridium putrefaciens]
MQTIKTIFKEISTKKFESLLIVIQLVITIIVLVQSYCNIKVLDYPKTQLKEINLDTKNIYQVDFVNAAFSKEFGEGFSNFNESLNKNIGIESIGSFDKTNTQFEELEKNNDFLNLRRSLTKGTFKEMYPEAIELYKVEYAIYDLMNINITEGRKLSELDFIVDNKDRPIPMLVSEEYKDVMYLNDILTSKLDDREYIVAGFFKKDLKWLDDSGHISKLLVPLNDKIITPYLDDSDPITASMIKCQARFYIHKGNSYTEVQNIIQEAKKFNLSVNVSSLDDQLEELKEQNKVTIFYGIFISAFVIILSCFGLSAIMFYSVNSRKREFGIRIMAGASIKHIKTLVVGEVVTLMGIALTISSIILFKMKHDQVIKNINSGFIPIMGEFSVGILFMVGLLLLVLSVLICLLPLIKVQNLQPKDLIGGMD